jgi:hypothetical protein
MLIFIKCIAIVALCSMLLLSVGCGNSENRSVQNQTNHAGCTEDHDHSQHTTVQERFTINEDESITIEETTPVHQHSASCTH